jgi:hypothetical protein
MVGIKFDEVLVHLLLPSSPSDGVKNTSTPKRIQHKRTQSQLEQMPTRHYTSETPHKVTEPEKKRPGKQS